MCTLIRFYGELNDFLPLGSRGHDSRADFAGSRSVKDLIEAYGVPHTEVDLILVNGESVGFTCPVQRGDRVSVYPVFEAMHIGSVSRLGRPPLREPRFIADVHLGKLARRLRLLGFDCTADTAWDDAELAARSAAEGRILLTRDRDLLKRAVITHGIFLRSGHVAQQLRQVIVRVDLAPAARPLSRCPICNGRLRSVPKTEVHSRVPPKTFANYETFLDCEVCGKVYWHGAHWRRLEAIIADALWASRESAG